jgi:hypothetical protein
LTDDGIHPNAAGNQVLAEHVTRALERLYGPAILKRDNGGERKRGRVNSTSKSEVLSSPISTRRVV